MLPGWPNPILVPYVPLYKHLGTQMEAQLRHEITRKRVAARCRSLLGLLGRLGVLNEQQFERASRAVVDAVIGYYGRSTPIDETTTERIETMRRSVLRALGHWPRGVPSRLEQSNVGFGS